MTAVTICSNFGAQGSKSVTLCLYLTLCVSLYTHTHRKCVILLFVYMYFWCAVLNHSILSLFVTPWTVVCQAPLSLGILQVRILRVGAMPYLQGIFSTQGSNPGLLHCRWILYCLSHQESPWILEWVDHPFSRGSSQPRNQTRVSCIAGGFCTSCATREGPYIFLMNGKYWAVIL